MPPPAVAPQIPEVGGLDADRNRVDDLVDREVSALRRELASTPDPAKRAAIQLRMDEHIGVEAVFSSPLLERDLDAFVHAGGVVRYVFRAVSYGFTGEIARSQLVPTAMALGPNLLLLKADRFSERHLDEATQTGRVRPVWAAGFAGSGGYSGASNINIAILDTGVDGSHPDLAGRMVGWKDYTTENAPSPIDVGGHGSHVAGIALGSGAAFGMGPGTLLYTDSGDLSAAATGSFLTSSVHYPASYTVTSTASWTGGGTSSLSLVRNTDGSTGGYTNVNGPVTGVSPLALSFTGTSAAGTRTTLALAQNADKTVNRYAITNSVTNYPAVGDGFPAMRGVASSSGWYGAKIFPAVGLASSADIAAAMDDIVVKRSALNIKVANMSFGIQNGGEDPTQRSKANTMVQNGIVVVTSAGNNGVGVLTGDPGRAANAITVGAANDLNQLTQYTSAGWSITGATDDNKPDILGPGGSTYRSKILSVDSNSADADSPAFADVRPNDYTNILGTSMASPFVAGSAALVIQALEQAGVAWSFSSTDSPFLVKTLLLASATETHSGRETGGGDPPVGRGGAPKDTYEGYGIINPDAAIEAATLTYGGETFSSSAGSSPTDRRAWGRKMTIPAGRTLRLSLDVPASGDYDLYLFSGTPGSKGNPTLLASSYIPAAGEPESLTWTAPTATTVYVFVKRLSGSGTFTLTGTLFTCGNGVVESGEQCDDSNKLDGDCCSSTCQRDAAGTTCNDSSACTQTDTCNAAGACVGSNPVVCTASNACHTSGTCNPATGTCSNPAKADGTGCNDGDACTQTDTCQGGNCTGSNPVVCGGASSCSLGGTCNPATGICSSSAKPDGSPCSDGNACTQTDTCQAGVCMASNPVVCTPPDGCHDSVCNTSTGACATTPKANGTGCDDGNACTPTDSCQNGVCTGSGTKACPATDECLVGACTAPAGTCTSAPKANGTPCTGGSCVAGTCTPTTVTPDAGVDAGSDAGGSEPDPRTDAGLLVDASVAGDASSTAAAPPEAALVPSANEDSFAPGGGCACRTYPDGSERRQGETRSATVGALVVLGALARRRQNRRQRRAFESTP